MAKSIAGGLPLGAVTGRAEIIDAPVPGGLGGTFAGNPVACAAALAVLDVLRDESLCERAAEISWVCSRDTSHRVIGEQDRDGANHGDHEAVDIEARNGGLAEQREDPTADDRPHDAEDQVADEAFSSPVDDLAAEEPGDDPKDDPGDERHPFLLG
jgi:hypothetical protein